MDKDSQILFTKREEEVTADDVGRNFDRYLNKRFPPSLRPSGRRKWKSVGFVGSLGSWAAGANAGGLLRHPIAGAGEARGVQRALADGCRRPDPCSNQSPSQGYTIPFFLSWFSWKCRDTHSTWSRTT